MLLTSLWLLFSRRERLEAQPLRPQPLAFALLVLLSAVWVLAWRAAIQDLQLFVLPAMLLAASLAIFGWPVTRMAAFPFAFLYFTLPFWSDLVRPLQYMSAKATGALIWLTGLPAYMQGDFIHVPAGTLRIAGGCSGLHYVVVGLALAALYGELLEHSALRRLGWLGLMGTIALLANWIRIYTIAERAYATNMQTYLVTVDHYWFGWVVFAIGYAAFLWIAGRFEHGSPPRGSERVSRGEAGPGAGLSWKRWTGVLLSLGALPALTYAVDIGRPAPVGPVVVNWPTAPPGWSGPLPVRSTDWQPVFQHASTAEMRRYVDAGGTPIDVFAVAYRRQWHGVKLVMYGNSVLGAYGTVRVLSERIVRRSAGDWRENTVRDGEGVESVIWSRYRIGRHAFVHPVLSQFAYGVMDLGGQPLSSLIALRSVCEPGCNAARRRLDAAARLEPRVMLAPSKEPE